MQLENTQESSKFKFVVLHLTAALGKFSGNTINDGSTSEVKKWHFFFLKHRTVIITFERERLEEKG